MLESKVFLCMFFSVLVIISSGQAQYYSTIVGSSYVANATAYSNGFKVAPGEAISEDTVFVVYSYDDSTVHWAFSYDRGETWESQPLLTLGPPWNTARNPSLDCF
ncbi:hypothetical protein JW877_00345, partial [bacterium]|nr:hypothetical protein [bacterium]